MRKKVSLFGIILLIFGIACTITSIEIASAYDPDYVCANEYKAPFIYFCASEINTTGRLYGRFVEPNTGTHITYYQIKVNNVELNISNFDESGMPYQVDYDFNVNDFFDVTPGFHNNITMAVYGNSDYMECPDSLGLNQGGGAGGSGEFWFCDTVDCWGGPMPSRSTQKQEPNKEPIEIQSIDYSGPILNFSFVDFACCGTVDFEGPYDDESGVNITDIDNFSYDNTTVVQSMNNDKIVSTIIVTWADSPTGYVWGLVDLEYVPDCYTPTNYPILGSLVAGTLIFVIIMYRKKYKR